MRLKTLAVILITAMAGFTVFYWVTDDGRREAIGAEQEAEFEEFGEVVFSNDPADPMAAGCARCHGPEGEGGPVPGDPDGRQAPSLHTASLAGKIEDNPDYVLLAVSYGGVIVSGVPYPESPMPPWKDTLNQQQLEAVVALVTRWAEEAGEAAPVDVEDTVEAGAQVFASAGCAGCHGPQLEGSTSGPDISTIGSGVITEFDDFVTPSGADQMIADYEEDPRAFLEKWIRDSATNYNDGVATGMPAHPEGKLNESQLTALITFLLDQTGQ